MKNVFAILALSCLSAMASCTKVIDVNLNRSNPQYIVEAEVTNTDTVQSVHITRSINFSERNVFPPVENALVIMSDGQVSTDTLVQSVPGYYVTRKIQGTPGHTYTLMIFVDGQRFTSTSTMPPTVYIDTLQTVVQSSFGQQIKAPQIAFHETKGSGNFYRYVVHRNGRQLKTLYFDNDLANEGVAMERSLPDSDSSYKSGELADIELQSISKEMYDYYFSLQQTIDQSSATPANPVTNIKGDNVSGYFSTYSADRGEITIH